MTKARERTRLEVGLELMADRVRLEDRLKEVSIQKCQVLDENTVSKRRELSHYLRSRQESTKEHEMSFVMVVLAT